MARRLPRTMRQRRGRARKGQVSAVATILGLLILVSFIANYLTVTLPAQMTSNELAHEIQVEDQVGRLQAVLQSAVSSGVVGREYSQPISLGSQGDPPFAGADTGYVQPENRSALIEASVTVQGAASFVPPTGYPASSTTPAGCSTSHPTYQLSCSGSTRWQYNLSANSATITVSDSGSGAGAMNLTGNSSTIELTDSGSGALYLQMIGSHDTAYLGGVGSGPAHVIIIGDNDNLFVNTTGSGAVYVEIVGTSDTVSMPSTAGSGVLTLSVFGTYDNLTFPSYSGSGAVNAYLNGFTPESPSGSACPYGNLSQSDAVASVTKTGSGTLTEQVNNTIGYNANSTGSSGWAIHYRNVASSTCPFFTSALIPISPESLPFSGFVVHLSNVYTAPAEVAFDQGAVIYAQTGGYPIMLDGPALEYSNNLLTLTIPQFNGSVNSETGLEPADLIFELISLHTYSFPGNGITVPSNAHLLLTIVTPFAVAWMTYLSQIPALSDLASCAGPAQACSDVFQPTGIAGKITLSIPVTMVDIKVALFDASID